MWAYYQEVRAESRGFIGEERENENGLAEEARRRIEDVTEEARRDTNGDRPTEQSLLLPAATRGTPRGEEGNVEHESDSLI